jgi:hypothetical protein
MLQVCEFYRQRFYLDPRSEWGLHWRAALLHLAKWPHHLCALYDVVSGQQKAYALTPKVQAKDRGSSLFCPHLIVILSVCAALIIRVASGSAIHPTLGVLAIVVATVCLVLIWTERSNFPPPYSPNQLPWHPELSLKNRKARPQPNDSRHTFVD